MTLTAEWEGQLIELDEIVISGSYRFTCTSIADVLHTPHSGETVTVLSGPEPKDEPEQESVYRVRFVDGTEGTAYQGELNGWYFKTGQAYAEQDR